MQHPMLGRSARPHEAWLTEMRGVGAVVFGIFALFLPILSLAWLALLFGLYAAMDGVLCIMASGACAWRHDRYGLSAIAGLLGVAVGCVAIAWPEPNAAFVMHVGVWWIAACGVIFVAAATQCDTGTQAECAAAAGFAALVFAAGLWRFAHADGRMVVVWLGCFVLVLGFARLILAARRRHWTGGDRAGPERGSASF